MRVVDTIQNTIAHLSRLRRWVGSLTSLSWWSQAVLLALIFLLPLFVIPITAFPFQLTKGFILIAFGLTLAALFLVRIITEEPFTLPKSGALIAFVFIPLAYTAAAFSSTAIDTSFYGIGGNVDTAVFMIALAAVLCAAASIFSRIERTRMFLYLLLTVGALIGAFHTIRLVVGPEVLTFGYVSAQTANLIGTWNDFGIFAGALALIASLSVPLTAKSAHRVALWVGAGAALFFLVLVNLREAWIALFLAAGVALLVCVSGGMQAWRDRLFALIREPLMFVFLCALIFSLWGNTLGLPLSNTFGLSYIEARPSWGSTAIILKDMYAESPLFGAGPNRFSSVWVAEKPAAVNQTSFWNVDFNAAVGALPTTAITAGILGGAAFGVFLLLFFSAGRLLFYVDLKVRAYALAVFAPAVFLWTLIVIYTPGAVVWGMAAILSGAYLGLVARKAITIPMRQGGGFVSILATTMLLIVTVTMLYGSATRYTSAVYRQASALAAEAGEASRAQKYAMKALRFHNGGASYQQVSSATLAQAQKRIESAGISIMDAEREEIKKLFSDAVAYAERATQEASSDYRAWMTLGNTYNTLASIDIAGAYDSGRIAYQRARALAGQNPAVFLQSAQFEYVHGSATDAQTFADTALAMRPQYSAAALFLSRIEREAQNPNRAEEILDRAVQSGAPSEVVAFELGFLRFHRGAYSEAVSALERAVAINPMYANARYFLALSYYALGNPERALMELEIVRNSNPDNGELQQMIDNIRAGRAPLGDE